MAKKGELLNQNSKKKDVRTSNIESAKAVADAVRTSLGPRGMDKMVGDVVCCFWGEDKRRVWACRGELPKTPRALAGKPAAAAHCPGAASALAELQQGHICCWNLCLRVHRGCICLLEARFTLLALPPRNTRTDLRPQRRGHHHQRRSHDPAAHDGHAARSQDAGGAVQVAGERGSQGREVSGTVPQWHTLVVLFAYMMMYPGQGIRAS